jgi:hypothetical protein
MGVKSFPRTTIFCLSAALLLRGAQGASIELSKPLVYRGMCDASAGAALDETHFVAASDEENVLRIFDTHAAGLPVKTVDLTKFLDLNPREPETDIEGAARIGNRIYWITSHSRNRHGHDRPDRRRFFATDIVPGALEVRPVGKPCMTFLEMLVAEPQFRKYRLDAASRLPPKAKGGLNIEGLAATPEGHLLIAFRSPVPAGQALLIPLLNPDAVLDGKRAQFGPAIELDLEGLGIRDIAWSGKKYVLIAGSASGGGSSQIYSWKGAGKQPKPLKGGKVKSANPEAILFYPNEDDFQVLCDSGKTERGGVECKDAPLSQRGFQGFWATDSKEP